MQSDPDLLLFTCIAEADVDGELNAQDARDNWEQIEQLARAENNQKWLNRAAGERSFSEFILGHITKGRILIATALGTAQKTGDVGGEIRYLTGVGATLYFTQQYDQALEYLTKADGLIRAHPQAGYGFVTNEYRLETLVGLKQFDEAGEASLLNHQRINVSKQESKASASTDGAGFYSRKDKPPELSDSNTCLSGAAYPKR